MCADEANVVVELFFWGVIDRPRDQVFDPGIYLGYASFWDLLQGVDDRLFAPLFAFRITDFSDSVGKQKEATRCGEFELGSGVVEITGEPDCWTTLEFKEFRWVIMLA